MLVSYLLFAYNHQAFIEEALSAALNQTYDPMEVIVTDDASSDETPALMERVLAGYNGPKSVQFIRNRRNLGLASSINNAVAAAKGSVLVIGAGDDSSLPHRTARVMDVFATDPSVQYVWSNSTIVDEHGREIGEWYRDGVPDRDLDSFANPRMAMLGATATLRRDAFDVFGPLDPELTIEDRVVPMRSAVLGTLRYLPEHLVRYRRHEQNYSHNRKRDVGDLASWFEFRRRSAEMDVVILRSRLSDLSIALKHDLAEPERIERIRAKLETAFAQAQTVHAGFSAPDASLPRRMGILAQLPLKHWNRRFVREWLRLFAAPRYAFRRAIKTGQIGSGSEIVR